MVRNRQVNRISDAVHFSWSQSYCLTIANPTCWIEGLYCGSFSVLECQTWRSSNSPPGCFSPQVRMNLFWISFSQIYLWWLTQLLRAAWDTHHHCSCILLQTVVWFECRVFCGFWTSCILWAESQLSLVPNPSHHPVYNDGKAWEWGWHISWTPTVNYAVFTGTAIKSKPDLTLSQVYI